MRAKRGKSGRDARICRCFAVDEERSHVAAYGVFRGTASASSTSDGRLDTSRTLRGKPVTNVGSRIPDPGLRQYFLRVLAE
jgi:hypothetical protein